MSSLTPFKGHHHLIDAVARLGARLRSRVRVVTIGELADERYAAFLRRKASAVEGARFELPGWQKDPSPFYERADVLVLPSVTRERFVTDYCDEVVHGNEGLPRAILEAMAHGVPVVATDVAGNRDVVEDGYNGRVVPPGNPVALAEAMTEVLDDGATRARMGAAALATARHLSRNGCVRKIAQAYRELVTGPALLAGSVRA